VKSSRSRHWVTAVSVAAIGLLPPPQRIFGQEERPPENQWEGAIRAFERLDKQSPPPQDSILFVGSSSIRFWDTDQHFPDLAVINRGFGGSQIADSIQFAERIILPYQPKVIVLYAGDNDIAGGNSPARVAEDFKTFVMKIRKTLPKTRIVFISIKPSIARWKLVDKMREANALIKGQIEKDALLEYVDADRPMLGADGMPQSELFIADGLHLNEKGYRLWASLVKPHLGAAKKAETAGK